MDLTNIPLQSIQPLLSPYLNGGRLEERWEIRELKADGKQLRARVVMTNYFRSPTDSGFHLSNLTGLEIVAQLRIILIHLHLNLPRKSKELWFLKGAEKCIAPIRDPENIIVEMALIFRKQGHRDLVRMNATVSDPSGGLFEYTATVLM